MKLLELSGDGDLFTFEDHVVVPEKWVEISEEVKKKNQSGDPCSSSPG